MAESERSNRLSPGERYCRDPHFAMLVNVLQQQLETASYTPTELREAVMLAAIQYERRTRTYAYIEDLSRERTG